MGKKLVSYLFFLLILIFFAVSPVRAFDQGVGSMFFTPMSVTNTGNCTYRIYDLIGTNVYTSSFFKSALDPWSVSQLPISGRFHTNLDCSTSSSQVGAVGIYRNGTQTGIDAYVGFDHPYILDSSRDYWASGIMDHYYSYSTVIEIGNPNNHQIEVYADYYNADGTPHGGAEFTIAPNSLGEFDQNGLGLTGRSSAHLYSLNDTGFFSATVVGRGVGTNWRQVYAFNPRPTAGSQQLYGPDFRKNYFGESSVISWTNAESVSNNFTLSFYTSNGFLQTSYTGSFPPHSTLALNGASMVNLPDGDYQMTITSNSGGNLTATIVTSDSHNIGAYNLFIDKDFATHVGFPALWKSTTNQRISSVKCMYSIRPQGPVTLTVKGGYSQTITPPLFPYAGFMFALSNNPNFPNGMYGGVVDGGTSDMVCITTSKTPGDPIANDSYLQYPGFPLYGYGNTTFYSSYGLDFYDDN